MDGPGRALKAMELRESTKGRLCKGTGKHDKPKSHFNLAIGVQIDALLRKMPVAYYYYKKLGF